MKTQQPLRPDTASRPRYLLLDLLRIGAALWVVAFHWGSSSSWMEHAPVWLMSAFKAGYLGVDVFFMLSGAVIAYTAIGRSWGEFAVARFLRLAPTFFGVTVLTIAFFFSQGKFDPSPMSWLNLTGLHFFFGVPSFVTVAWTLLYELEFYVLIGILILISRNRLDEDGIRRGAMVFLIVALFAQFSGNSELQLVTISGFGGMFAFGALLGISRTKAKLQRNLPALVLATTLTYAQLTKRTGEMAYGDTATTFWSLGILIFVGGVILLSALRPIDIRHQRLRSSVATFAVMTYPIYLFHLEIGMGSIQLMRLAGIPIPITAILALSLVILLSWLFARYYEPWARKQLRTVFGWSQKAKPVAAIDVVGDEDRPTAGPTSTS